MTFLVSQTSTIIYIFAGIHISGRQVVPDDNNIVCTSIITQKLILRMTNFCEFLLFDIQDTIYHLAFHHSGTKAEANSVMLCKACQEASKLDQSVRMKKCIHKVLHFESSQLKSMKSPQIP